MSNFGVGRKGKKNESKHEKNDITASKLEKRKKIFLYDRRKVF